MFLSRESGQPRVVFPYDLFRMLHVFFSNLPDSPPARACLSSSFRLNFLSRRRLLGRKLNSSIQFKRGLRRGMACLE
jgi:hypothetical protein